MPKTNSIVDIGYVLAPYQPPSKPNNNILSLKAKDTVYVLNISPSGWLDVILIDNNNIVRGWFPQNYIRFYNDPKTRNLHFNKLMTLLSSLSGSSASSSSSSSSSTASSSPLSEEDELEETSLPVFNSIQMEMSHQSAIHNDNFKSQGSHDPLQNGQSSNKQLHDPLQNSKLYSKHQIEHDFYHGKFNYKKKPIIWQIILNTDNNNIANNNNNNDGKLIYYNNQLNIHLNQLPILIDPSSQSEKLNDISNLKQNKPFLAQKELFYHDENDHISMTKLFENVLYSIALLKHIILSRNKMKIYKIIQSISLGITYILITIRQIEPFIITSMKRQIRLLLKSILKSSSLINLNSNIHFSTDSISNLDKNSLNNTTTRNNSIDTTTSNNTLKQQYHNIQYSNNNNNNRMTSVSSNFSKNSTIDLSPRNDSMTIINIDILQKINNLMLNHIESLQISIQLLFFNIHNCVNLSNNNINDKNRDLILPQILPRFFAESYGNGSWSNCFMDPISSSNRPHHLSPHLSNDDERLFSKYSTTSITSTLSDGSTVNTNLLSPMTSRFINEHIIQDNIENFMSPVNSNNGIVTNSTKNNPSMTTPKSNHINSTKALVTPTNSIITSSSSNYSSIKQQVSKSISSANISKNSTSSVISKNMKNKINNRRYPLNRDTLKIMKKRKESLYHGMVDYMKATTTNAKADCREILKIYTELHDQTVNMYVMENLDLSFFHNLRNVIDNGDPNDETTKLLNHISSNIMLLLNNYFEIKQAFYDAAIDLTLATQQVTLDDPKVFNSMLPYQCVGAMERFQINDNVFLRDGFNDDKYTCRADKFAKALYKQLTKEDTDINDHGFVNTHDEFKTSYSKYYDINCSSYSVVEKLLEEKERIINFTARTMQDRLITELQKNEYKDARWFESDFSKRDIAKPVDLTEVDSSNDSLPWYLQTDYQDSIIFDTVTKNIKFGTKEGLVSYLVYGHCNGSLDAKFMDVFLLTFKSMYPSTTDMVSAIIAMYHLVPPEGLTFNEYNEWMEKKLNLIKINVVKVLREFFKNYWIITYWEPALETILFEFSSLAKAEEIDGAGELFKEIDLLVRHSMKIILHDPVEALNISNKDSSSQKGGKSLRLANIAAAQFAQQVTLINHEVYCKINIFECLDRIWGKQKLCDFGGSPSIGKFIEHANLLTNYVSYKIVSQPDLKKRVKMLHYFITVALYCQRLSNFASLTAIISALYSSPVHRLHKTWSQISKDSKEILQKLDNLMDSKKNFINYRECLRSTPKMVACVPFFGVYLSDLTFANSGNQDSPEMINFRKRVMIHDIIKDIQSFQNRTYITLLAKNNDVKMFILDSLQGIPDIDKQYELSLIIEPRGSSDSEERRKSLGNSKFWRRKHGIKFFG